MLRIIGKIIIRIKGARKRVYPVKSRGAGILAKLKLFNRVNFRGLFKNPLFYFGFISLVLFGTIYSTCDSFASFNGLSNNQAVFFNPFFSDTDNSNEDNLFLGQGGALALEPPDLKIIQDNCICGVATPRVLSPKVLGDMFGGSSQNNKEVVDYNVQPGDTLQSIANAYGISLNTLLWANELTSSSKIKVGQGLIILPTSGLLHVVKSGDTISEVAKKYKAKTDDIVAFNDLTNEGDIYIGDILVVPGGVVPPKASPQINIQAPLADNFFIFPTEGKITQALHYYNGVDIANKCGTSVYAAASGTVQRVKYGYNAGGGNYITILHSGGIVTWYGHLMTIFIKPGDKINVGDRVALMGGQPGMAGAGRSTGCHLHFTVIGAKNPLAKYYLGSYIKY